MASAVLTDSRWIARGRRTNVPLRDSCCGSRLGPCLLAVGVYAAGLCLFYGLNQTNMDNRFAFGLWIFLDLGSHRAGGGRVLHRISGLHPEAHRAETNPQYRRGRGLHLL